MMIMYLLKEIKIVKEVVLFNLLEIKLGRWLIFNKVITLNITEFVKLMNILEISMIQ